jgi:hypothetical protein
VTRVTRAPCKAGQRWWWSVAVASHTRSLQASDVFFNRVREIKSLQAILAGSPSNVLVLLGPPSCGKSGAHARLCGQCSGANHFLQRFSGS